MKKLYLVVTAILVLALGILSCTTTTDSDITSDLEEEPEETPLDINWLSYRVGILSSDLDDLFDRYPIHIVDEELSFSLVLEMALPAGLTGFPSYLTQFSVDDIEEARTHIANATSLLTRGCLPGEQVSREVTGEELAGELEAAMSLLQKKVDDTYTQQSNIVAWVENFNNWVQENEAYSWFQLTEEAKDTAIVRYIDFFDEYRDSLSQIISELEFVLSRID